MKVLVLYSELAGYIIKCLEDLSAKKDVEVTVVNWPVNKEAPFKFENGNIAFHFRDSYTDYQLLSFAKQLMPDIIISSGWMDKGYNKVCKSFKNQIPVIVCFDNHWTGSIKQKLVSVVSKFVIRDKFNTAWVPGEIQATFARKLGFKSGDIYKGFYAADTKTFVQYYNNNKENKSKSYPKRILFVGRYVKHKGIYELWDAFKKLKSKSEFSDWELWCVGTGDQWENRDCSEGIKHFGFLQPEEFDDIVRETSVYVLPSKFEPWGVSLQEFASAGYPIVASADVGSTEAFCNSQNSFIFNHKNKGELRMKLIEAMEMTQVEFISKSIESNRLGDLITAKMWSDTVIKIGNGKN